MKAGVVEKTPPSPFCPSNRRQQRGRASHEAFATAAGGGWKLRQATLPGDRGPLRPVARSELSRPSRAKLAWGLGGVV